jgi:hypothetical protein
VDVAGNSTTVKVHYTVEYVLTPLSVSGKHRVGDTMQVATRLTDAGGHRLSNDSAAKLGCRVKLRVSGAQTHHSCLTYDKGTHLFSTSWKLGSHTGAAELRVAVTYPGSSVKSSETKSITIKA